MTFDIGVVPSIWIENLFKTFSKLPQKVIFKTDIQVHNITIVPENILVRPFVPQQEILAHPNTILFFTHFGMKGTLEAIYYGVPMVGMPLFNDQGDVRARVEDKGIGVGISKNASQEEILKAIITVRDSQRYDFVFTYSAF